MPTAAVHEQALLDPPPPIRFSTSGKARHDFMAFLPPAIYERKMVNAIADLSADVISFGGEHVQLAVGRKTWFRQYTVADFPVNMTIHVLRDTACPVSMTHVAVVIQPVVVIADDVFEARCLRLIHVLRSCLAAADLVKKSSRVA